MRQQEVRELYEAYMQVHRVQEEVEVVDEAREANRDPEGYEERQRTSQSSRQRRMNDPNTGINSPAFHAFMAQQMGGKKKKKVDEETDLFDTILEYLVAEGYADTNESALVIMANMSEEWRQSIVEEVLDEASKADEFEPGPNWDASANRGKGAHISPKQKEKQRRKGLVRSAEEN
jgi:hypothetical protein